jgi:hypothetical protein
LAPEQVSCTLPLPSPPSRVRWVSPFLHLPASLSVTIQPHSCEGDSVTVKCYVTVWGGVWAVPSLWNLMGLCRPNALDRLPSILYWRWKVLGDRLQIERLRPSERQLAMRKYLGRPQTPILQFSFAIASSQGTFRTHILTTTPSPVTSYWSSTQPLALWGRFTCFTNVS